MNLVEIVAAHADGIGKKDLLRLAREHHPDLTAGQLETEIELAEGDLVVQGDVVRVRHQPVVSEPDAEQVTRDIDRGLTRLVAVDLETVLRFTKERPEGERTIFQIGAVRFGPDVEWASSAPFDRYLLLPDELRERLVKPELREAVQMLGEDPAVVLEDLLEYIDGADAIVAYNGRSFDFPLLDDAITKHLQSKIPTSISRIDGLYVAVSVWPVPPRAHKLSHLITSERLEAIRNRLEIDLSGLQAHKAADDSRMLAELMRFAAAEIGDWSPELRSLVRSVSHASDAWSMLFSLGAVAPAPRAYETAEVRQVLALSLGGKEPLRREARVTGPGSIDLTRVAGDGGVDIDRLVRLVKGENASVRDSQRHMVEAMRDWIAQGFDALVEAPTGTGKSYAILAVALEWLAADPRNRVVLSTFTRQLQRQLANDIFELHEHGGAPGLIEITSLVKGAANRLSLAGLVRTLADSTLPPPRGRRKRGELTGDPLLAELALYLTLRLRAQGTPVDEWEAHSVDPVDIEPFFDGYLRTARGGALRSRFLKHLSQAESSDYGAAETSPAEHTSLVREVLSERRLVVTNHALLFAHLEDFADRERTLVIVDEAHSLESAATGALARELDFAVLLDLLVELRDWVRPPGRDANADDRSHYAGLMAALGDLTGIIDLEHVQLMATTALNSAGRDPLHPDALRVVTLASSVANPPASRSGFIRTFEDLAHKVIAVSAALRVQPRRDDRLEEERRQSLVDRLGGIADSAAGIVNDLMAIVAPSDPLFPPANRVVWLEEVARGRAPADLRFIVRSAPIELSREETYVRFTTAFARTYYISATLKVDGSFAFMRQRLALPEERVREIELDSPFDLPNQARLVAFTDFPSWAEQEDSAIRSVAHQVGRYLAETGTAGHNGAMVLTTSKNAANRIYEETIRVRGELGREYAISSAGYLATATAVEAFKQRGGGLVGTKGLWQGVDIADPERLRIVWINKLPFAPFADPLVVARRELVRRRAEQNGEQDPDGYAVEHYYLPLAAMELRQAVGRLIRSSHHRGLVVISDRKLGGPTRLHRRYRQVFLGSLAGFVRDDTTWGPGGGNLFTMADGWREIWRFLASTGVISYERLAELTTDAALDGHTVLPETLEIRRNAISSDELAALEAQGPHAVSREVLARSQRIAGLILRDSATELFGYQSEAIAALAEGRDVLTILPTSAGKSFIFQLPALALPGVTLVVSPLVALMTDQALGLNRSIGGSVRALVAPMRESNSRTGKAQVAEQLTGIRDHGIRLIYVSPERLSQRQFQDWIMEGLDKGIIRRIAIDEAHTFATWGDDFRPSILRAERFLERVRAHPNRPRLLALTATATPSVRHRLRKAVFGLNGEDTAVLAEVIRNPIRPELALYRKMLGPGEGGAVMKQRLLDALVDSTVGHTIIYTLTVKEARKIHAALLEHMGEGARHRIRLFHGRLTAVEKEAIAADFHSAPAEGDDDFESMIVVATAAFGLGVDRKDVRTVIVASPPADLAGLYQEIGRAGRDKRDSVGIMLSSGRAFGTLAFMDRLKQRLDFAAVERIASMILGGDGPFDADDAAETLLNLDVASGAIGQKEADKPETVGNYRTSVVRVLAHLADAGCIDDRGDFPETVRVVPRDDAPKAESEQAALIDALIDALAGRKDVKVLELAERLAPEFPGEADDPGDLWTLLLELHSLGYLDVSQQPNRRMLTSLSRLSRTTPAGFVSRFAKTVQREEREYLVGFFSRNPRKPTCVNDDFRGYFEVGDLPDGTCSTDTRRCSGCWLLGHDGERPATLRTLTDGVSRVPKLSESERKVVVSRATRNIERLLRIRYRGLQPFLISQTLRGQDAYFSKRDNKVVPLYPELVATAVFGSMPSLQREDIDAAIKALVDGGRAVMADGNRVRLAEHVANDEIRAARAAAKAAASAVACDEVLEGEMESLWDQADRVPERGA